MCFSRRSTMEGDGILPKVKELEEKTEDLSSNPKIHTIDWETWRYLCESNWNNIKYNKTQIICVRNN